jgi:hypothetical protein
VEECRGAWFGGGEFAGLRACGRDPVARAGASGAMQYYAESDGSLSGL